MQAKLVLFFAKAGVKAEAAVKAGGPG